MTTKLAILSTLGIFFGGIVLGIGVLVLFVDPAAANANERAAMLGQGLSVVCLIPLCAVWIMWGVARQNQTQPPKKKRRRPAPQ